LSDFSLIARWKRQAKLLRIKIYAIYFAYKDPRVPWYAKAFAACIVAYAFSPIDLIPDFIPILGYLDDIVLIPLGITLALKMIPTAVIKECEEKAQEILTQDKPKSLPAAAIIVAIWVFIIALFVVVILKFTDIV
jgi:uncharacterized membrane protein YkvA (DUF1232 family)